jgi:hypothetical protein
MMLMNMGESLASPALANAGVIDTSAGVARVNPAAAVTGVIMAPSVGNRFVTVVNEGAAANTILFDVPGTSNVADGGGTVPIAGLTARSFVWDSTAKRWFRVA